MKKHLGKIILCTTLALATPFALIGCSKKAANNQTPDNNEQEQQQEMRVSYVKEVTWPNTAQSVTKTTFENDDAVRAALVDIMYDPSVMNAYKPTMQPGEEGYEQASAGYQQALQQYRAGLTAAIDKYIKDTEDGQKVNSEYSNKYVYTVTEDMIPNHDSNKSLGAYYEEYFDAYAAKYSADENWKAVPGSEGVFYTSTATEDILVCFEIDSPTQKITLYELSFSKDGIETAYAAIQAELSQNA